MSDVFRFFLLGLGSGGVYALLSLGVVLVYRGSGVVNFAAGAFALFGAAVYYECQETLGDIGSLGVAVAATALLGVLVQLVVMGPMRRSSPLARVVATLAIMSVLQQAAVLRYGNGTTFVTGVLPTETVTVFGVLIGKNYLYVLAVVAALLLLLSLLYSRTRFGLLTAAGAEDEIIVAAQGSPPSLVAAGNWALGGALAGLSGSLLVPIVGLNASVLPLAVVPALAAALVGGFNSFWITVAGSLLIGVLQSETNRYVTAVGWSEAIPFLVIVFFLVVRGKALPLRSHLTERLPRLGAGRTSLPRTAVALVAVGVSLAVFSAGWSAAVTTSVIYAVLCLSLVVVTGLCGQLSLAQLALAGIGALVAGRLADNYQLPFPLVFLIAVVVAVPVGLIVALPAVRVRGINLAVLTLGLSVVVTSVILNNPARTGGPILGTVVDPPTIFGLEVSSIEHPQRYAWVCLAVLVVAGAAVCNVRRGRTGRRMIAVRDNERAAASLGVSVVGAKLYAFGLAAALAAAAGVLTAFRNTQVTFDGYNVLAGVHLVLTAVLGGIGYVLGAPLGGSAAVGGSDQYVVTQAFPISDWFLFISASLVLVNLVFLPDGIAAAVGHQWRGLVRASRSVLARIIPSPGTPIGPDAAVTPSGRGAKPAGRSASGPQPPRPNRGGGDEGGGTLELRGVTVKFGGVTALDDVSFHVRPGEVVGLIGPNGAGKTTLVDVATGYVPATAGEVRLGDCEMTGWSATRRTRRGLTRSFQSLELFEDLTVVDNLRVASDRRDRLAYLTDLVRPGRSPLPDVAQAVVEEFELAEFLDRTPDSLAYAQRHLVAIARAVATAPSVLLLDEPAAGLDEVSTRELGTLVRRLAEEWGMGVLLIDHNVPLVLDTCDRIVVLDFGRVIAEGGPETIRQNNAVITAYLGDDLIPPDEGSDGADPVLALSNEQGADHG